METKDLLILAVIISGFIALAFYLKSGSKQTDSTGDMAKLVLDAQERLQAYVENRLGAADTSIQNQVNAVTQSMQNLLNVTQQMSTARATEAAQLAQATSDTKAAVDALHQQTAALSGAMSGSQARGKWGEISLRKLVESTGMQDHVDFVEQKQEVGEGIGKPDITVMLPNDRVLYIDSKAPWSSYQQSLSASDENVASAHLAQHVRDIKGHIDTLAKRDYIRSAQSLDYVIMYVPVEAALSAALQNDSGLLEYAAKKGVVITSPLSLIVILNNFHKAWDDDAKMRNVDQIISESDELVRRVTTMVGHVGSVGDHLQKAGKAYNDVVASYNSRVVPQSQKLDSLREKSLSLDELKNADFEPREFKSVARAEKSAVEEIRLEEDLDA